MDAHSEAGITMTPNNTPPAPEESSDLTPLGGLVFSILAVILGAAGAVYMKRTVPAYHHYPWEPGPFPFLPSWLNDFYVFELSHPFLMNLASVPVLILGLIRYKKAEERLIVLFFVGLVVTRLFFG